MINGNIDATENMTDYKTIDSVKDSDESNKGEQTPVASESEKQERNCDEKKEEAKIPDEMKCSIPESSQSASGSEIVNGDRSKGSGPIPAVLSEGDLEASGSKPKEVTTSLQSGASAAKDSDSKIAEVVASANSETTEVVASADSKIAEVVASSSDSETAEVVTSSDSKITESNVAADSKITESVPKDAGDQGASMTEKPEEEISEKVVAVTADVSSEGSDSTAKEQDGGLDTNPVKTSSNAEIHVGSGNKSTDENCGSVSEGAGAGLVVEVSGGVQVETGKENVTSVSGEKIELAANSIGKTASSGVVKESTQNTHTTAAKSSAEASKENVDAKKDTGNDDAGKEPKPSTIGALWISGLSSTTRAADLKYSFAKYGKVTVAKIVTQSKSFGALWFGFVTMATTKEAEECIKHLNQTELQGKVITVEKTSRDLCGSTKKAPSTHEGLPKKKQIVPPKKSKSVDEDKKASEKKKGSESVKNEKEKGATKSEDEKRAEKRKREDSSKEKSTREKRNRSSSRSRRTSLDKSHDKASRGDVKHTSKERKHRSRSKSRTSHEKSRHSKSKSVASPGKSRRSKSKSPHDKKRRSQSRSRARCSPSRNRTSRFRRPHRSISRNRRSRSFERQRRSRSRSWNRSDRQRPNRSLSPFHVDDSLQRELERKNRLETHRLERERERLRLEKEELERERARVLRLEKETQRMERERIEREMLELQKIARLKSISDPLSKRSYESSNDVWRESKRYSSRSSYDSADILGGSRMEGRRSDKHGLAGRREDSSRRSRRSRDQDTERHSHSSFGRNDHSEALHPWHKPSGHDKKDFGSSHMASSSQWGSEKPGVWGRMDAPPQRWANMEQQHHHHPMHQTSMGPGMPPHSVAHQPQGMGHMPHAMGHAPPQAMAPPLHPMNDPPNQVVMFVDSNSGVPSAPGNFSVNRFSSNNVMRRF